MNQNHDRVELNRRYKQLGRIITEGMLLAEKSCCRSKHGYAWSTKFARAGKLVWYWKRRKSLLCNRTEYDHLLALTTLLEVEDNDSLTISEIDQRLTGAQKALKRVQKNEAAARDTHLEELAQHRIKHRSGDLVQ
eukprot:12990084-Ditylum_brightwellii.AAC.1